MPTVTKQSAVVKPAAVKPKANGQVSSVWDLLDANVKLSLYGRSGTGKTTFWGLAPKPIKALICTGGDVPGELRSLDTPENRKLITPVLIESTEQFNEEVEKGGSYATWVLDHGSGFQDMVLKEILGLDEAPAQRPILGGNKKVWGDVAIRCKEAWRKFLNIRANIIFVCHERVFSNDDEEGSEVIAPVTGSALTPSMANWLNGKCDYICQTFLRRKRELKTITVNGEQVQQWMDVPGTVEYCLRTGPSPTYYTKFRRASKKPLPELIADPDWSKLLKLIQGK